MKTAKTLGKILMKTFIWLIQIPLTVIYFILSFFGSVISGLGWLFRKKLKKMLTLLLKECIVKTSKVPVRLFLVSKNDQRHFFFLNQL